ncbi:MAG: glucoamylase family protein [Steroidobacteraceae bacterium]
MGDSFRSSALLNSTLARRLSSLVDKPDIPTEGELWDVDRLERHGRKLADNSGEFVDTSRLDLRKRLRGNASALESAYAAIVAALRAGRAITPAAQWLVDNFHVISEQLSEVPLRLTPTVWRDLPAANHPEATGWPRIFHIATEYLRHTLWEFNPQSLLRLLAGYQNAAPLRMREIWALYPILRIALVDELRRIAVRVEDSLAARAAADELADSLLDGRWSELGASLSRPHWLEGRFIAPYIVQLAHRLHGMGERGRPLLDDLSAELARRGTTIDDYIQRQHARRSASNLVARNIITSLRALNSFDWRSLFESTSRVELLLRTQPTYVDCDRRTRDRYRNCVEELAMATHRHEVTVTQQILELVGGAPAAESTDTDIGSWLIGPRRHDLEIALQFPVSLSHRLRRRVVRHARGLYVGGIGALVLLLTGLAVRLATDWQALSHPLLILLALLAVFPTSELAIGFLNRLWLRAFPPQHLPRLALQSGLYAGMKTLVVVPILLRSPQDAAAAARQLHVHALANPDPLISFALLSDWTDSATETARNDAPVLEAARREIAALNHGAQDASGDEPKFFLLHRRRLWSEGERCFMGWERKRGKLEELNRLLLGRGSTSFLPDDNGVLQVPKGIRYVLTVDGDTRLPMGCVKDLVGIAAHPLNQPVLSPAAQRVVQGYAVLQPRITPLLPGTDERSLYREIIASGSGVDPYAAAVSDLHQDVFGEGLFTGKGLYDLKAWDIALADRVPENALLSHDLFEGLFARCGLVSDIELFEDFPSHSEVAAARSHRWIRGDWQLVPWIAGLRGRLPPLGRWKMLDNLRRSLNAPCCVALLIAAFADPSARPFVWLMVVLGPWLWPALSTAAIRMVRWPAISSARTHVRRLVTDLGEELARGTISLCLLAQNAWLSVDAISRALFRLVVSKRHLLEWVTAAQLKADRSDALTSFVWPLKSASIVVVAAVATLMAINPAGFNSFVPLLLLWWLSPLLAQLLSQPLDARQPQEQIPDDVQFELRGVARLTWTFFERFVTAEDNFLPPDNYQEDPAPVLAHRSSPTNFGLYLLSTLAARDFGWLGLQAMTERLTATLATLSRLERFEGHFLNWYDTRSLAPLLPRYVSTVDSGNLAGHLLTLRQACIGFRQGPVLSTRALSGPLDALALCREALAATANTAADTSSRKQGVQDALLQLQRRLERSATSLVDARDTLLAVSQQIDNLLRTSASRMSLEAARWLRVAGQDIESHLRDLRQLLPDLLTVPLNLEQRDICLALESRLQIDATLQDVAAYLEQLPTATIGGEAADAVANSAARCAALSAELEQIPRQCHAQVASMSFGFLFDRDRGLFSIGYRVADGALDSGFYDLLASEARLASLVAIAKGDVPRTHWTRLGRRLTGGSHRPVLASWSGSMFEYLMPALVMHEPRYSLLDQTNQRAVQKQISYGDRHQLPWGISESAYNIRDREYTYQYSSFGLPSLGLKRGLAADYVVAPYASALAAMYRPVDACENYRAIALESGKGYFGYYEALDFTASRLPEGKTVAVVRAYMAHHQGMSLVALDNVLQDRIMQARFHAEPGITASDLLLQERSIRFVEAPALVETDVPVSQGLDDAPEVSRTIEGYNSPTPVTHLLSNRNYTVMLTDSGGGYSNCRTRAVTRWREDATQDCWGTFIYLQDLQSEKLWSAGFQPTAAVPDEYRVHFNEEGATIARRDGMLRTTLSVVVAPEDDGELRRITLRNDGARARVIALTSYAEIVLAPPRADIAHPGFSNLFIQTEFLPGSGALLATRRPRSNREAQVWAIHVIAGSGDAPPHLQYETDRSRFLGRGRNARLPQVMHHAQPLSNTAGNVLDPIFSLRTQVVVPARASVTVTFATFVAESREQALALIAKYRTPALFEHISESAWTFARAELYYLQSSLGEAMLFQTLASHLLLSTQQLRARKDAAGPYSIDVTHLWRFSISGDRPILLIRCHSQDDLGFIQQCLRGQEYLRIKRLAIDVVILNELRHSYVQDLQQAIERTARAFMSQPVEGEDRGGIYPLAIDSISDAERNLLLSLARVVLNPAQGSLLELLYRPPITRSAEAQVLEHLVEPPEMPMDVVAGSPSHLEFFNGWGGFSPDGREYVISLTRSPQTPAPWSNVLANEHFGSVITERGSMCTWSLNSRENQLTAWSNDAVCDPSGEAFYLLEDDGELWSPAAQPIRRREAQYEIRHGQGYSQFDVEFRGLASRMTVLVAPDDPVKLCRLRLTNHLARARRITVISYVEWALGATRSGTNQGILTRVDSATGAQFASNPALVDFGARIAFCDFGGRQEHCTDSRHEFLGRNGSPAWPAGLRTSGNWSPQNGAGRDPCCAFAFTLEIAPGASDEMQFVLGQAADEHAARQLVTKYRETNGETVLADVQAHWDRLLGAVQIRTPDRALDLLFNRWLLYQTIGCRLWGRAAFYQAGGAFGFRDQLQDGMALTLCAPDQVRAHLLRAAARQFVEGDVQHWWHPPSGRGVRTHFSDDRIWLPFVVHQYMDSTHDVAVLDEIIPFIEGPPLPLEQEDAHYVPTISRTAASLYEHCARALDISLATGAHDLPLMGGGDWNDGMNRVGHEGRGESVWLAWFLITTLRQFVPVAEQRRDHVRADRWRTHIDRLTEACESDGWDGDWYRRAFFDDGTPLGSAQGEECRIDSLVQSWAVLSGAAAPARARAAMQAVDEHLVKKDEQLVLLFAPPFDVAPVDPGYIKGYLPGLRENGGQYTHAAIWVLMAQAMLKNHARVGEILQMLNPVRRSTTPEEARLYRVEPYVVAADIYSGSTLSQRGGWSWYTGASGWFYRAILEQVLGIRISGDTLHINPCPPPAWEEFEVTLKLPAVDYLVRITKGAAGAAATLSMDGELIAGTSVPLLHDDRRHVVELTIQ